MYFYHPCQYVSRFIRVWCLQRFLFLKKNSNVFMMIVFSVIRALSAFGWSDIIWSLYYSAFVRSSSMDFLLFPSGAKCTPIVYIHSLASSIFNSMCVLVWSCAINSTFMSIYFVYYHRPFISNLKSIGYI